MGVTVQWLKFSLNKFCEQFQIREIKDPRNISAIQYTCVAQLSQADTLLVRLFLLGLYFIKSHHKVLDCCLLLALNFPLSHSL